MEIRDFINVIKTELPDSKDFISYDTKFRELEEWDSLTGMSIVVLLEEIYDVSIPEDIFKTLNTFQEIFDYISCRR